MPQPAQAHHRKVEPGCRFGTERPNSWQSRTGVEKNILAGQIFALWGCRHAARCPGGIPLWREDGMNQLRPTARRSGVKQGHGNRGPI